MPRDRAVRRAGADSEGTLRLRSVSTLVSVVGTGMIWLALLGPVIALLTHMSWQRDREAR